MSAQHCINFHQIIVMRYILVLLTCLLPALAIANGDTALSINGVNPGEVFSYGCHELRWTADKDENGLIGLDEV